MSDEITINPQEQVHLTVAGVNNRLPTGEYLFERSKTYCSPSIHIGHGLVTLRSDRTVPVRLLNTGNAPVRIFKGMVLGDLTHLPTVSVNIVTMCDDPTEEQHGGPTKDRRDLKPSQSDAFDCKPVIGTATGISTPVKTRSGHVSKPAQSVATELIAQTPVWKANDGRRVSKPARVVTATEPSHAPVYEPMEPTRRVYIETADIGKPETAVPGANYQPPRHTAAPTADKQQLPSTREIIDKIDLKHLTVEQQQRLKALLLQYDNVLSRGKSDLGKTGLTEVKIDTGDNQPVRSRPYRQPEALKHIVDKEIDEMLDNGIIQPSISPWCSPIVLVKKSDGSIRFCVDFRKVNALTKCQRFAIPRIQELVDQLGGANYFTSLDLASAYWQVKMHPDHREKTAFICHRGAFEFTVLPFGLTNAPAIFQRLMSVILCGLPYSVALAYLDDLVVSGRTFEENMQHLECVLQRLQQAGLKLKPSKCHWAVREILCLGHVINPEGVKPNPTKVKAVTDFLPPTSRKQLQSFLGLANYYRRNIEGFAHIAGPLTDLLRKECTSVSAAWTTGCQKAFDELKRRLTTAPILAHPDFSKPFLVKPDASAYGVGAVLSQVRDGIERVVAYSSRGLNRLEKQYAATEREALAALWAVKHFRPYIYGTHFVLVTDHSSLQWLKTMKDTNSRLQRWSITMSEYDYEVKHKPGKQHTDADALSRLLPLAAPESETAEVDVTMSCDDNEQLMITVCPLVAAEISVSAMRKAQLDDPLLAAIVQYHESETFPHDSKLAAKVTAIADQFVVEQGLLYKHTPVCRGGESLLRLVVPPPFRQQILCAYHDHILAGHLGFQKSYDKLRRRFHWPKLYEDTKSYIKSCDACNARKRAVPRRLPIQPIPVDGPFDRLSVDVLGPLPTTYSGNKYIVVATDAMTRWAEAFATKDQTSETLARVLVDGVICRHGCPRTLLTDRGKNMTSAIIAKVCALMNTKHLLTTAYHPQTDGMTERFNATLEQILSVYTSDQKDWDQLLPLAVFAYNTAIHSTTRETPFNLIYGRNALLPLEVTLFPQPVTGCVPSDYKHLLADRIASLQAKGHLNILMTQKLMQQRFPPMSEAPKYEIGQNVWVLHPHVPKGLSRKLYSPWKPFIIAAQRSPLNYTVRPINSRTLKTVHVNKLKPRTVREPVEEQQLRDGYQQPPTPPAPPAPMPDADQLQTQVEPDDTHLEPERIIDCKTKKDGVVYFKVLFKGLPRSQAAWTKIGDISDTVMIQQYLNAKHARKERKSQQEKWTKPQSPCPHHKPPGFH
jgi:transposase InsO family protein